MSRTMQELATGAKATQVPNRPVYRVDGLGWTINVDCHDLDMPERRRLSVAIACGLDLYAKSESAEPTRSSMSDQEYVLYFTRKAYKNATDLDGDHLKVVQLPENHGSVWVMVEGDFLYSAPCEDNGIPKRCHDAHNASNGGFMWDEVTAVQGVTDDEHDQEFLDLINKAFDTNFTFADFAGR